MGKYGTQVILAEQHAPERRLGALDALTRIGMQDLIERVWRSQGETSVPVTHDVGEAARLADRVVVLERGRIAESWQVALRPRLRSEFRLDVPRV